MIIEITIAIILGVFLGIISGLVPGIHINLVAVVALTLSPLFADYISISTIAIAIIVMAITHTFLDFVPSSFLGAPESDNALSVLPAHRLLLKGRGYEAVKLSTIGCLAGLIAVLILTPLLLLSVPKFYNFIESYIVYILIASVLFLIIKEKKIKNMGCFNSPFIRNIRNCYTKFTQFKRSIIPFILWSLWY